MDFKRKTALVLLVLLLIPFVCSFTHTEEFYVNDYAGVLTNSQESGIVSSAKSLAKETGAQVVVLTVESLEGRAMEEYAIEVAREWGIGDKEKNNGVLILLSTGDREIRVEVGFGLEGCLPDGKTGRLIDDYAMPYYSENDFANGTEQLFYAVLNVVRAEYSLDPISIPDANADNKAAQEHEYPDNSASPIAYIIVIIIVCLLAFGGSRLGFFPIFFFGGGGRGGRGGFGGGSFGGGGGFGGGGAGRKF